MRVNHAHSNPSLSVGHDARRKIHRPLAQMLPKPRSFRMRPPSDLQSALAGDRQQTPHSVLTPISRNRGKRGDTTAGPAGPASRGGAIGVQERRAPLSGERPSSRHLPLHRLRMHPHRRDPLPALPTTHRDRRRRARSDALCARLRGSVVIVQQRRDRIGSLTIQPPSPIPFDASPHRLP